MSAGVSSRPAAPLRAAAPAAALVTGAARRIGRAMALDLAHRGWAVAVHYNTSADAAGEVVGAIREAGGTAVALRADLRVAEDVEALIPAATDALGPLGLLVNNASVFEPDSLDHAPREIWDAHMESHLRAPFLLTGAFARQLPAEASGLVINMLDARVWNPAPGFSSYTASKVGLWTLTRTLAQELAPRVRVNAIGPGPALPNSRQSEADFARQCRATPLGVGTSPAEICTALQFILAAPAMTGQMIALDGGQHLGWAVPGHPPSFE